LTFIEIQGAKVEIDLSGSALWGIFQEFPFFLKGVREILPTVMNDTRYDLII
jgi:hypothetical protein